MQTGQVTAVYDFSILHYQKGSVQFHKIVQKNVQAGFRYFLDGPSII